MRPIRILINAAATTKTALSPPVISQQQRSPWHSPVPYLFGGLAAMLGLIAFALLILACSYWRLSGRLDDRGDGGDDIENSNGKETDASKTVNHNIYEEKILVIMAGEQKPTFLATPVSSRASCFGDKNATTENTEGEKTDNEDKLKGGIGTDHVDQTAAAADLYQTTATAEAENGETQQVQEQNS